MDTEGIKNVLGYLITLTKTVVNVYFNKASARMNVDINPLFPWRYCRKCSWSGN